MVVVDGFKIEGRSKWEFYVAGCVKSYKAVRDSIIKWKLPNKLIKNLIYEIPHRPYRDWFLFNDIRSAPEWEVSTISYETAWPIITKKYYWLVLPDSIKKRWKQYFKFIAKDNISIWDSFSYIHKKGVSKLKIQDILWEDLKKLETINCNTKTIYILTDKILEGWEVIYK